MSAARMVTVWLGCLALCAEPALCQTSARQVRCADVPFDYQLFVPDGNGPFPAVLLLHGAGGRSSDLMDLWRAFAAREHIVLVAPQLPRVVEFEEVAPATFQCIMNDARRVAGVDGRRVYLFGYSMGGYLAYDGAMLASRYFAGAGVYAAAIADDYVSIVDRAERKIPIAIYVGSRDQYVSLDQARKTRDLLTTHGFPVRYLEFPDVDHRFTDVSDRVVSDAWRYLSAFARP